ncbi:NADPH:quinone reductase-like Zn-dependent oxidoreductase [Chitinivorax tropicus]|uniref:NADPH:quinone reductase-like Zn-dependent oxidoreductase n=1 Tax=Chitinivorax tropicus TaxID=714531 RepID=A0A840MUL6_9PROT|nr:NAD(P)-dependent alcohol dehydrogenase [Chitinivorax tropicus]MBB5020056.1 NADPH:quinone reductase-like Zn-dependent oxidoreductase [Chitinivorax tropicus]
MKVMSLSAPGLANLQSVTLETPTPGHGEVLVKLHAASLNYVDWMIVQGMFPGIPYPIVPVADGAGEIAALGDGVTDWQVGDRVVPHFYPHWATGPISPTGLQRARGLSVPGSLAEFTVVPAAGLIRTPAHLTDREAATLPIAATTAWNAIKAGRLTPGSTVLLLGTGVVSLYALQFAKASGAKVIITSSSDAKLDAVRRMGADHTINYRSTPAWDVEVQRLTEGRGVDLVVETGGNATFGQSLNAAALGATIFVIGMVTGHMLQLNLLPLITKGLRLQGNNTGSVADLAEAARAITAHQIRPLLGPSLDWRHSAEALACLETSQHLGKITLQIAA